MSYEGEFEYLCERGHYHKASQADVVRFSGYGEPEPETCLSPGCSERMVWHHSIDLTNGSSPSMPRTLPAPKVEVGWDDIAKVDHYGNHYFEKAPRYEPSSKEWRKLPTEAEENAFKAEWRRQQALFSEPADKFRIFNGTSLLFTCDSEAEFEDHYDQYLAQGLMELQGYYPDSDTEES